MLLIDCPWCGPRDEPEFRFGVEADATRPDPASASDADWSAYLFLRTNRRGTAREIWCHAGGCGQWFLVERDTVSHAITATSILPSHASTATAAS